MLVRGGGPLRPPQTELKNGQTLTMFVIRKMSNYLAAAFLLAGAVPHARARTITSGFVFSGQINEKFMRTHISAKSSLCMMADQKMRVFLVRHGAVDLNSPGMVYPKDCFYGGQNVPLSLLGKVEAQVEFTKSFLCESLTSIKYPRFTRLEQNHM